MNDVYSDETAILTFWCRGGGGTQYTINSPICYSCQVQGPLWKLQRRDFMLKGRSVVILGDKVRSMRRDSEELLLFNCFYILFVLKYAA